MRNVWILLLMLLLTACGGHTDHSSSEGRRLMGDAYDAKDYPRLLSQADSLLKAGQLSSVEAAYWQGYACDRMLQRRMAEFYWKSAITEAEHATDTASLTLYAKAASRLTNVLSVRGEYDEALKVAMPAAKRLEQLHCDTTSDYTNLLIYIGCCQTRFGLTDEEADKSFERAWQMHQANIRRNHTEEAYKNAIAGVINIAYNCLETRHYEEALKWTARYAEFIGQFEAWGSSRAAYVDKQWARYDIYRAIALEGLGRQQEAANVYDDYMKTQFSHTNEGRIVAADYLVAARRWKEAADSYQSLDALLGEHQTGYSLENIQKMVLPRYNANVRAGLGDSASAVACSICESLDSAITQARRTDAEELATISQKEEQIAWQRARITRQRTIGLLAAIALIFLGFTAYTLFRRRTTRQLAKAHEELKTAYGQLEESTRAKERMESELRLAHAIRQKMLPADFAATADADIYAALLPASEMGGDFYDYLVHDNRLFFCIGGVGGGQGVAAALLMASAKAWFRATSAHEEKPGVIVAAMNKELTRNGNAAGISIALFAGVLDLDTGRLHYANAGHTPPLLVGSGIGLLPADTNAPLGMSTDTTYADQETLIDPGTIIFLYTDGLTNAENSDHKPFGQKRVAGEALQTIHGLDASPKAFIERMTASVNRFRGDAGQKGDLTMLAVRYLKKAEGIRCQRSITLPNDRCELPRLQEFSDEVCRGIQAGAEEAKELSQVLESAVGNVIDHAYRQGTKGDISVEARADSQGLTVSIIDNGHPFDPTVQTEGAAIALMRAYAASIGYKRKGGRNILTLTKQL